MKSIALKAVAGAPTKKKALAKKAARKRAAKESEIPDWVMNAASLKPEAMTEEERAKAIDAILDEAQQEKVINCTAEDIIKIWR